MIKSLASLLLAVAALSASAAAPKAPAEVSAASLSSQLLTAVEKWTADPKDSASVASELKADYRVLRRNNPAGGLVYGVIAPGNVAPGRLIQYGDSQRADGKKLVLQRAWLQGHFFILQFDGQTQYRDLRKADAAGGLDLAGYINENGTASGFTSAEAFEHALKTFVKISAPRGLAAAAGKIAGGKAYTFEAPRSKDRVAVGILLSDGTFHDLNKPAAGAKK